MITIANANALHIPLPDKSVQCVVTSPPYWSLRDYGVDGQIGLEATPAEYVAHIVAVMREVWRVLKDDGTCWLNLGDSYAGGGGYYPDAPSNQNGGSISSRQDAGSGAKTKGIRAVPGLKSKDLCGIPWRVAFALQDDGWYLRSDIIWNKPNPMPESVTDRPTKAHEYVFLLTKQARYYYDAEAIKETRTSDHDAGTYRGGAYINNEIDNSTMGKRKSYGDKPADIESGRNRRSVWTVATQPYSGAHFATFPPALIEPMILAGTSARGECPLCGKAWVRDIERVANYEKRQDRGQPDGVMPQVDSSGWRPSSIVDNGWRPQCACWEYAPDLPFIDGVGFKQPLEPIPQTVLDPFGGSGTTGQVAVKHGRKAVLLDLNTKYIDLQFDRVDGVQMVMSV